MGRARGISAPVGLTDGIRSVYHVKALPPRQMGKQAKLKQIKKQNLFNGNFCYLDLSPQKAADFRNQITELQLSYLPSGSLREILMLPSSFVNSFYHLFGHVLVGARHWEFWSDIRHHLTNVTLGEESQKALAAWNWCDKKEIYTNPRIYCFNLLQKAPDMPSPMRLQTCRKEILRLGLKSEKIWYQQGIPHHIGISGTIAGNGILHNAGSLYLLDAGKVHQNKHELWLARLRHDGIYATSKLAKIGNLRPSEIKSMKQFILNYRGKPIGGTLETLQGNEATRICKAIGMTIEEGIAWIGK